MVTKDKLLQIKTYPR